jgi:O-antigen/teichoic acid export membrane protein
MARPPRLAVLIGFNGVAQIAPIVAVFAVTPLLLDRLGLDRFGIWSLALVILTTLTALDGGVSASLARFFAVYAARGDTAATGRLLLASLLFFAALGAVLTAAMLPLVPTLVGLLSIPSGLTHEAEVVLRWLPPLAALGLMADSSAALLQGTGRFRGLAASMIASSAAFVGAIIVLVQRGGQVDVLLIALGLRYFVLAISSLVLGAGRLSFERPLLPSRATTRELWTYSSRMQLSAVTGFVNSQMDALVIAAVLPVRYVGLYGIGMQAASALRSVPLYAFAPLLTLLAKTFGDQGREATAREFSTIERRWLPAVLGYGVVAIAGIGFAVPIWLGDRYALGGVTAAILLTGYSIHVSLTGMRTCYVRAVGRPGLETRYSLVWTVTNAATTVPAAIAGGLLGVVGATAATGVLASVYFVALCRRTEHLDVVVPEPRWWRWAAVAVCLTVAGELAIVATDFHGFFAFALAAVPGMVAFLTLATGARLGRVAQPAS